MPIDAAEVIRIASLARLDLDPAAVEKLRSQMQTLLDYVAMLETVDVDQVPPTAHTREERQPYRPDETVPSLPREVALASAPDAAAGHFRVPRVLKE